MNSPPRACRHAPARGGLDKGVRGFDLEGRGGGGGWGKRADVAGTSKKSRQHQYTPTTTTWRWLPDIVSSPPASDSSFVRARRHPGWLTDRQGLGADRDIKTRLARRQGAVGLSARETLQRLRSEKPHQELG